jgi:hypothetical protein
MCPYSCTLVIHRRSHNIIAPPPRGINPLHRQSKEDEERGQRQAQVQAGRRQEVGAAPPPEVALLDPELKDEADDAPGEVVERGGGRDGSRAAKEERRDEVFDWGFGIPLGGVVDDDGGDGAENEEEEEAGVNLARREHSPWADEAPDDGC